MYSNGLLHEVSHTSPLQSVRLIGLSAMVIELLEWKKFFQKRTVLRSRDAEKRRDAEKELKKD